ncbi:ras-domain-containing protein [Coniochaeta sp. PMI_546]|nr:ras-domain-containing protein [Coniochaeta sp. PMI_546]
MTSHYSTLGDHFGIIIAYDISARNSWEEACRLHNTIDHGLTEGRGTLQILILGLKADLKDTARHVPRAEAETFAKQHNCRYSECSARTGEGVHEAFGIFVEHAYATSIGFEDDLPGLQSRKELGRKAFRDAINTFRAGHTGIPSGGA